MKNLSTVPGVTGSSPIIEPIVALEEISISYSPYKAKLHRNRYQTKKISKARRSLPRQLKRTVIKKD